jgi:hypothetical protein
MGADSLTVKEFGRALMADKPREELDGTVEAFIERDFNRARANHFPDFDGGYQIVEGGIVYPPNVVRADAQEMTQDDWDIVAMFEPEEDGPQVPEGYAHVTGDKPQYVYGWVALVPVVTHG